MQTAINESKRSPSSKACPERSEGFKARPEQSERVQSRWKQYVNEHWLDFVAGHFNPLLSVGRILAKLESVREETADTKTFILRPNIHWSGFIPGQYVPVRVRIDGVRHERYYSLVSDPAEKEVAFTVKRQSGGKVSNWLHDQFAVGDVIELGEPAGEFTLPREFGPLLLIAGGSGITPIYSLLRAALAVDPRADIVLAYYARTNQDFAFQRSFERAARLYPNIRVHLIPETGATETQLAGRFNLQQLQSVAPDFAQRLAYVCGPEGLMDSVTKVWSDHGASDRLRMERFGLTRKAASAGAIVPVSFRRSQQTVVHNTPSLLETAEAAGLRPASGCRMGICRTCVCTKVSGITRDTVSGEINQDAGSRIRLCVSEPLGPVTLDI